MNGKLGHKEILLHIGTGKTGTTSIQSTLYANAQALKQNGVAYPVFKSHKNHNGVVYLYKAEEKLGKRGFQRGSKSEMAKFQREYRDAIFSQLKGCDKAILSGERMASLDEGEIGQFISDLVHIGYEVLHVLIYVREPSAYYLSWIQQQLKASTYVDSPHVFKYGFFNNIRKWESATPARLEVRPFDRPQLVEGSVVSDFLAVASGYFGISLDGNIALGEEKNRSISAEGMLLLQNYRRQIHPECDGRFKADSTRLAQLLEDSWERIGQTKPKLSDGAREIVRARYVSQIQALETRYNFELASAREESGAADIVVSRAGGQRWDVRDVLAGYDSWRLERLYWYVLRNTLSQSRDL